MELGKHQFDQCRYECSTFISKPQFNETSNITDPTQMPNRTFSTCSTAIVEEVYLRPTG